MLASVDTLTDSNALERTRRHSIDVWTLTRTGRRRLHTAQASPEPPVLPESPQHPTWRSARTLADQVRFQLRRLASASYCLHGWTEPTDDRADVDLHEEPHDAGRDAAQLARVRARRQGRRNTALWHRSRLDLPKRTASRFA